MSNDRPKRETMSIEEPTITNIWEITTIVELLERTGTNLGRQNHHESREADQRT
jgi:hypothetical protein